MAQFKFELEGVLRQRTNVEQMAQREVAIANAAVVELQEQLKRLDSSVKEVTQDVRDNHLTGPIDVSFITAHRRYLLAMERNAIELARSIAEAQAKLIQVQQKLIEASRAKKTIEKLREKQLERWKMDEAKSENARLDEAGMQIAYGNLVQDQA